MKKIILFAAIALAACVGRAEYLYWQIGDNVDATKFDSVSLWGSTAGGDKTRLYGWDKDADLSKTYETDLGIYSGDNTASFYIEVANYENGAYNVVDTSKPISYSDLAGYVHSSMQTISNVAAYTGATYTSVPEPTSGLMLLMGMALVALKRKRA